MWETHRFLVQSPKTERYAGHRDREVPLFPELQEELQRLFDLVNPNDNDFIIQSYQGRDHWSLTGPFAKISKAAGLGKIAQPFLNMRRSRSNEILRVFGEILESLWLGHSPRVMRDHYLFPMIADYANAAMVSLRSPMPLQKSLQ
jgi:integrase